VLITVCWLSRVSHHLPLLAGMAPPAVVVACTA
jgi:hypothetical protein